MNLNLILKIEGAVQYYWSLLLAEGSRRFTWYLNFKGHTKSVDFLDTVIEKLSVSVIMFTAMSRNDGKCA